MSYRDPKNEIQNVESVHDEKDLGSAHEDPLVKLGHGETLHDGAHTREVKSAELFAALQETNIKRWSKSSLHLYLSIFTAFLCACANGYDGSLMTAILAMPHFQETFNTGTTGLKVSLVFSLYTVGSMIAAPFAAVMSDRFGRRKCMFVGAFIILAGMAIAASGKHVAQLVVGRFVLGAGIQFMTVAAPAYAIEVSPPHWKGRATGFYNCGWFGGSIPAAAVTFGTNYINSNISWQLPIILQAYACVFVMVLVFFIPESPRFHMANGREDLALEFMAKYHGNGDPNAKLVLLEMEEMREGIVLDGIDKRWWDYRPLIMSHQGRWRMAQVLMISIFGQFSGNGLGYFNTVIYNNLGVTSVPKQLGYNLLSSVVSAISALSAVSLTDKMKRRPVLIFGTLFCAILLAINSGLTAALNKQQEETGNIKLSYGQGALAAYFLFNCAFSFAYTPLQAVLPAESLETTARAKGFALSGIIVNAIGFINQFAGPVGLKNMGYKYIYIFVGWDLFESLMWYFFCVESQGRTLEELAWVYDQPNPVKASLQVTKIVQQSDGHVSEKLSSTVPVHAQRGTMFQSAAGSNV